MADLVGLDLIINDLENARSALNTENPPVEPSEADVIAIADAHVRNAIDEATKLRTGLITFFALIFVECTIDDDTRRRLAMQKLFDDLAPFDRAALAPVVDQLLKAIE